MLAVVVLALAVWLVPTAFGSSGVKTSASTTTSVSTTAATRTPAPHTGCTHAPTTAPQ
jgi:guanyl-specific ribonuclease Sa